MGKVGIFSDAHFSLSSSVLSRRNGYIYSERLDYLVKSFEWMSKEFIDKGVDLIINGGDLTNSEILQPEENSALYDALSYISDIKEFYVLGNHEIKDKNSKMSSVSILNGYPNITIYSEVSSIKLDSDTEFVIIPYKSNPNEYEEAYKLVNESTSKRIFVFSHASYIGENYNNFIETEGIDRNRFMNPNLLGIFNGHIHNIKDEEIYHQIGSLTGNSFGDNYSSGYPGIIILDTDDGSFERIPNPYAVIFLKMNITSLGDLIKNLKSYPADINKCVRVETPVGIKDQVTDHIESVKDNCKILEYRIRSKYEVSTSVEEVKSLSHYKSPYDALKGFIESQSSLPYDKSDMIEFLDTYVGG